MGRSRKILEPVSFFILAAIAAWLLEIVGQQCSTNYQIVPIIILEAILYFLLGVFLNCVNRNIDFHARRFSPFHLAVLLLCLLFVVCLFEFNSYLPGFISAHTSMTEFLLLSYAGANLPSAFFDR